MKPKLTLYRNPISANTLTTGLRLFIASLILTLGIVGGNELHAMVFAGAAMVFPAWKGIKGRLANGAQAEADALVKAIDEKTQAKLDAFKSELLKLSSDSKNGMISKEEFEKQFGEIAGKLKKLDEEKFKTFEDKLKEYESKYAEQQEALKTQGAELKKMKESGVAGNPNESPFRKKLKDFLTGADYKAFADSGGKKKASMEIKAVDMTNSYTGTSRVLVSTRSTRIVDHPVIQRLNVRDLLRVDPIDLPYLAFLEVYDWIRNVGTVSENGMLPESSFKLREATSDVKRVGTFINISKRMLKSIPWVENYLANNLPAMVRYAEDFQLLYGDGLGNNPTGLTEVARDFVTEINTTLAGIAGSVTSIASYDGGTKTLVTFTANQDIVNGDRITFAATTGYNATYTAIVRTPREIVIEATYAAGSTAAWTWTVASRFKNNVPFAQEIDVLKVAKALISRREYAATGIVIHPDDAAFIEMLKGSDQRYLDVQRFEDGILRISGVPVVETTAMPSGKFLVGDFNMAAGLLELTPLILEMSESTQEKLTNTVVAIVQEEIIFPIYNRYMFVFGDFTGAKAAILKP
jgi:HK97 family phage major capsid protein